MPKIVCPAAEEQHPILSPNPMDVECRIAGHMRPAESPRTGELAICCRNYTDCKIWKEHKRANWIQRTVAVDEQTRGRSQHTLRTGEGHERERVS